MSDGDGDGDECYEEQHRGRCGEQWWRDTSIGMLKEDLTVSGPLRRNLEEVRLPGEEGSRGRKQQSPRPRGRSPLGSQDTSRDRRAMPVQQGSGNTPARDRLWLFL